MFAHEQVTWSLVYHFTSFAWVWGFSSWLVLWEWSHHNVYLYGTLGKKWTSCSHGLKTPFWRPVMKQSRWEGMLHGNVWERQAQLTQTCIPSPISLDLCKQMCKDRQLPLLWPITTSPCTGYLPGPWKTVSQDILGEAFSSPTCLPRYLHLTVEWDIEMNTWRPLPDLWSNNTPKGSDVRF